MVSIRGKIVTPTDVIDGYVLVDGGRIIDVSQVKPVDLKICDFGEALILPGFIDLHTHGLGKYEPLDTESLIGMAKLEPQYGTTALLPTGAAMSSSQYVNLGDCARQAIEAVGSDGARILGVHLEGPFINPKSSGAMALSTRRPITQSESRFYVEQIGDLLKIMTFSPELEGGVELIKYLRKHGIVAALGHSVAEGAQCAEFVAAGLSHVVHMFNAFVPSGEKEQGVLKAGLIEHLLVNEALTCEFICDMQHVAPEFIKIASKVLGTARFVAITDSVYGAGLADGIYAFPNGGQYRIAGRVARLVGGEWAGCLAGSVLTMNRAFGNLIEYCDIDLVTAAKYTSGNAARVIGVDHETGSIETGKRADIAVLDDDYQCLATFIGGNLVYQK
ncbi:N-acetylglucosamine-6-phosphate deacetylase [candidate division KSB1 bacterium]|nr:N-acetylglucosamine-6-phosphate deacetylase [candidate division KSB1 bacterium]